MEKQSDNVNVEVMDEDGSVVIVCHNLYREEACAEQDQVRSKGEDGHRRTE